MPYDKIGYNEMDIFSKETRAKMKVQRKFSKYVPGSLARKWNSDTLKVICYGYTIAFL